VMTSSLPTPPSHGGVHGWLTEEGLLPPLLGLDLTTLT